MPCILIHWEIIKAEINLRTSAEAEWIIGPNIFQEPPISNRIQAQSLQDYKKFITTIYSTCNQKLETIDGDIQHLFIHTPHTPPPPFQKKRLKK